MWGRTRREFLWSRWHGRSWFLKMSLTCSLLSDDPPFWLVQLCERESVDGREHEQASRRAGRNLLHTCQSRPSTHQTPEPFAPAPLFVGANMWRWTMERRMRKSWGIAGKKLQTTILSFFSKIMLICTKAESKQVSQTCHISYNLTQHVSILPRSPPNVINKCVYI